MSTPPPAPQADDTTTTSKTAQFFAAYFWFILKNVIGWMLILGAFPIGVLLPGPGGLPMFLIGFALVWLPGKRRLTARALRGRQLQLQSNLFYAIGTVVSLIVPVIGLWIIQAKYPWLFGGKDADGAGIQGHPLSFAVIAGLCVVAALITWLLTRLSLRMANVLLVVVARGRRSIRPWLRKRGVNLLPPRRRNRVQRDENEILEIDEQQLHRARRFWHGSKPWLRRAVGVAVTAAAWSWILTPLVENWSRVSDVVWSISAWRVLAAVAILSGVLAIFRAMTWRHMLLALGLAVPMSAALRIWCTIELARYIPGGFFPLAGRINLVRPYGIDALVCTATHAIELAVFFLANVIVAAGGLLWFAATVFEPHRMILFGGLALLPLMLVLLHPDIFYRMLAWILRGLGFSGMTVRLPGAELLGLLGWMILGVLVQLLAIWILFGQSTTFDVSARHLPLIAAAYSLAWCIGMMAVWVPAGIGLSELVFIRVLLLAPITFLGAPFASHNELFAMLALMAILLRLWSLGSDVLLTVVSFVLDYRAALISSPDSHPEAVE